MFTALTSTRVPGLVPGNSTIIPCFTCTELTSTRVPGLVPETYSIIISLFRRRLRYVDKSSEQEVVNLTSFSDVHPPPVSGLQLCASQQHQLLLVRSQLPLTSTCQKVLADNIILHRRFVLLVVHWSLSKSGPYYEYCTPYNKHRPKQT